MTEAAIAALAAAVHGRLPGHVGRRRGCSRSRSQRCVNATWGDVLAWDRAGRWAAGATLVVAAVYQLTPLKDVCLGKCRSPLGFLLGSWRDGRSGALRMGAKNGAWCVGCCWALMASLFALGIMSVVWMAVVAGLIAVEKTLPWRRVASYGTAAVLLALGVLVLIAPTPSRPHDSRRTRRWTRCPPCARRSPRSRRLHAAPDCPLGPGYAKARPRRSQSAMYEIA